MLTSITIRTKKAGGAIVKMGGLQMRSVEAQCLATVGCSRNRSIQI